MTMRQDIKDQAESASDVMTSLQVALDKDDFRKADFYVREIKAKLDVIKDMLYEIQHEEMIRG